MSVRIVGICASPRRGNTEILVREALRVAHERYGASTEMVAFWGKEIRGCLDCKACIREKKASILDQCILKDDWRELVRPLVAPVPDGVIIGTPVYFYGVPSRLRAFMERCTSLMKGYWHRGRLHDPPDWSLTAAGALAVGFHRNGGQEHALSTVLDWFLTCGFVVVGSFSLQQGPLGYIGGAAWEDSAGRAGRQGVLDDEWGLMSARAVGEKVARTAVVLQSGRAALRGGIE